MLDVHLLVPLGGLRRLLLLQLLQLLPTVAAAATSSIIATAAGKVAGWQGGMVDGMVGIWFRLHMHARTRASIYLCSALA